MAALQNADQSQAAAPSTSGVLTHVPQPYPANSIQVGGSTGGSSGGGGNSGGGSSGGGDAAAASALRFAASCQAADKLGAIVRSNGSASAVTTITNATAAPAIGIIISKSSDTACVVQSYGLVSGVVSGLQPNARYFVGPSGQPAQIAAVLPSGGNIQAVGFGVAADTLFVQPTGTFVELAPFQNSSGGDATPSPSDDGSSIYYGGILYGLSAPTDELGRKGDSYLQYTAEGDVTLWGPKSDSGWSETNHSLMGPAGQRGSRIYVAHGPPDPNVMPDDYDVWFDQDSQILYPAQ